MSAPFTVPPDPPNSLIKGSRPNTKPSGPTLCENVPSTLKVYLSSYIPELALSPGAAP